MRWFGWFRHRAGGTDREGTAPSRRFVFVRGRRYVADAPYMLPKDEAEINRLDFQHFLLRSALRGNFAAPIDQPRDILDVGCGTGRWPLEMAALFPGANVIGLDIVPPPVDAGERVDTRPENYVFVQGNVLEGLPFPDATFDFVHQRLLIGAIPAQRWPGVVRELVRVTRQGGWVELIEPAPVPGNAPGLATLSRWMAELTQRRGIDMRLSHEIGAALQAAGLRAVVQRDYNLPIGRYGGRIGQMAEANYLSLLTSMSSLMVPQGITTAETFAETMRRAREELARGRHILPYYLAYGQRVV
ncbi:MAG: class I SAM-dependent methyltransferase [Ktedonobacterales bacterium]|nr:class I SAM-dependent methyltransferase [Ktedonobacterales bacterium]